LWPVYWPSLVYPFIRLLFAGEKLDVTLLAVWTHIPETVRKPAVYYCFCLTWKEMSL
jgi:hypothetical protein